MKPLKWLRLFAAAVSPAFLGVVLATSTLAVYVKDQVSLGSYGVVSLRSYFEKGTGRLPGTLGEDDPGDPYVITRPRHLYNLSRLQGLGVFGKKTYFQLGCVGLAGDTSGQPLCYADDSTTVSTLPYLNMGKKPGTDEYNSNFSKNRINAIGSEAFPFYGIFDGQNVEIKSLNVYADPQDAGLFGYTAHGSVVKNLFLSEITINSMGYTSQYEELYSDTLATTLGPSLVYSKGEDNPPALTPTSSIPEGAGVDYVVDSWTGTGAAQAFANDPEHISPEITFRFTNQKNYKPRLLCSGNLVTGNERKVSVNLLNVFSFFEEERRKEKFPINASASVSLIVSKTDSNGLDHTRVLMGLDFEFTLNAESDTIKMRISLAKEHGDNIGLIAGHCDGTITDCYVHNGYFNMNMGSSVDASTTYYPLAHNSTQGLVGFAGNTVHNVAAEESDTGTKLGKSVGALNFTHVYDSIVKKDGTSFNGSETILANKAVSFVPDPDSDYLPYLRYRLKNGVKQYATKEANTVSLIPQKVIQSDELGVFTVATDYEGTGTLDQVANNTERSIIRSEDVSWVDPNDAQSTKQYYLYYSTGEYDATKGISFTKYRDSFVNHSADTFFLGHHLPSATELSKGSMSMREAYQNYFFRFKLDPTYRKSADKFYFADVDMNTAGGSFLSKYFSYKLVNADGHIKEGDPMCGVMLRYREDDEVKEVDSFGASFATPDYSKSGSKMYCLAQSNAYGYPAANMVNFEITAPGGANVTVVAGRNDKYTGDYANIGYRGAALGVYRYKDSTHDYHAQDNSYINKGFESPDYAFFMPDDEHLAYFDYKVCGVNPLTKKAVDSVTATNNNWPIKGRIGTYNNDGTEFTEASYRTSASMPREGTFGTPEYGQTGNETRLFVHTFNLPAGKYCLGSATGTSQKTSGNKDLGIAKIYYICAQGQDNGDFDFDPNAYSGGDIVDKIDFLKRSRFETGKADITFNEVTTYDENGTDLENQRCYVSLTKSNRSSFASTPNPSNLSFVYDATNKKFVISSTTTAAIIKIVTETYGKNYGEDPEHLISGLANTSVDLIDLLNQTTGPIIYPVPTT